MNIILIGMPGCGKTTTAKLVASALGYTATDTDEIITRKHGRIPEIFEKCGEAEFRRMESGVVKELSGKTGLVIATGGGCVLDTLNVKAFKKSGKIFYLKAGVDELLKRLKDDSSRPLLKGDKAARLKELYDKRSDIYLSAADFIIDCDGLSAEAVRDKILEIFK